MGNALFFGGTSWAQNKPQPIYDVRRVSYTSEMQDQHVSALCAAPDGTAWVGTSKYLYRFDGFGIERLDSMSPPFPVAQLMLDTIAGDQLIWACGPFGAKVFDLKTGRCLSEQEIGVSFILSGHYTSIAKSTAGFYWLLCGEQLFRLTKTGAKRYRCQLFGAIPPCVAPKLAADPLNPNGVWLLPKAHEAYYGENGAFRYLKIPFTKPPPSTVAGLAGLVSTAKGLTAWTAYRTVYRIDPNRATAQLDENPTAMDDLFPGIRDMDQFAKQKGLILAHIEMPNQCQLFGTNVGLFVVQKKWAAFKVVKPLVGEEIRGIYARGAKEWWVGTYNGLYKGSLDGEVCQQFDNINMKGAWGFLPLTHNLQLLALENYKGISVWDAVGNKEVLNGTWLRHQEADWMMSQLAVCRDTQGTVWVGGYHGLLWAPPQYPLEFRPYLHPKTGQPLKISLIRTLLADVHSGLWVGWEKGLLHLAFKPETQSYEPDDNVPALEGIAISHLYRDRSDHLWIATKGAGLACLDLKNRKAPIQWYNSEQGLCNDFICRIEASHQGQVLWLSTHKGLARFDVAAQTFHNFYEDSGFYGNEFNSGASASFPDGTLMFGGISGLVAFHPNAIVVPNFRHKVAILAAKLFDPSSGKLEKTTFARTAALHLPPYPEYLELQLGTSAWLAPSTMRFRYRLRGASDLWTYTNGEPTVKFIGLTPGNYTFEVQPMPPDGHVGELVVLPISVASPYYETWWFKTCVLGLLAGIIYLLYRYRLRQLLREQQMRRQIADDLHDDIGNKLNIIGILAQKAANASSGTQLKQQDLAKLTDLSRNALRALHTMIWSVDADKDHLSNLLDRMQDFADDFLRPLSINFQFNGLETIPPRHINMQVRHHIVMVYQELLTNMVKYTHPERIAVSVALVEDALHILIHNHHQPNANATYEVASAKRGQDSIKRRLERIQAHAQWHETDGQQTVALRVPMK